MTFFLFFPSGSTFLNCLRRTIGTCVILNSLELVWFDAKVKHVNSDCHKPNKPQTNETIVVSILVKQPSQLFGWALRRRLNPLPGQQRYLHLSFTMPTVQQQGCFHLSLTMLGSEAGQRQNKIILLSQLQKFQVYKRHRFSASQICRIDLDKSRNNASSFSIAAIRLAQPPVVCEKLRAHRKVPVLCGMKESHSS